MSEFTAGRELSGRGASAVALLIVLGLWLCVTAGWAWSAPPQAPRPPQAPPAADDHVAVSAEVPKAKALACGCSPCCTCGCQQGEPCQCGEARAVVSVKRNCGCGGPLCECGDACDCDRGVRNCSGGCPCEAKAPARIYAAPPVYHTYQPAPQAYYQPAPQPQFYAPPQPQPSYQPAYYRPAPQAFYRPQPAFVGGGRRGGSC